MNGDAERPSVGFEPLRPASRGRLVAGLVLGPILWLIALAVVSWVLHYTYAIQVGLLVTIASFLVAVFVLVLLRAGRRRQESRYVARG